MNATEESHTIRLQSIQIDKYETSNSAESLEQTEFDRTLNDQAT